VTTISPAALPSGIVSDRVWLPSCRIVKTVLGSTPSEIKIRAVAKYGSFAVTTTRSPQTAL
jgi:hypothetical protein